jgi:hypothetical protein
VIAAEEKRALRRRRLVAPLLVVVVLGAASIVGSHLFAGHSLQGCGGGENCPGGGAPSNLTNALTGARTYYNDSGHTFRGMLNTASSTTTAIQDIGTGVSFAPGLPSTGPKVISADVRGDGSYMVLTAYASGPSVCFGILDVAQAQARPVLRIS